MTKNESKKESSKAIRAIIMEEKAKPRMARSAKIAELNLDTARIPEQPSVTLPGTVYKIVPASHPSHPEKAQIAVGGADRQYRDLRIENTLTDEHGDDVKLKKGAHVEVTVTDRSKDASLGAGGRDVHKASPVKRKLTDASGTVLKR